MKTPDTEKLYQEKELAYQMKATGNRSQTDHTPDTEWEEQLQDFFDCPLTPLGLKNLRKIINKRDSSRDTYWRERVRKAVGKIEESVRTQDTSYEYGEGTYEGMLYSISLIKDITYEDNLK